MSFNDVILLTYIFLPPIFIRENRIITRNETIESYYDLCLFMLTKLYTVFIVYCFPDKM